MAPRALQGGQHREGVRALFGGLGLAILATIASFVVSQTSLLWPPGVAVGLVVLAIALVAALRETSVVFAVIMAAFFLAEPVTRLRVVSIVTVAAGAVAIKIF